MPTDAAAMPGTGEGTPMGASDEDGDAQVVQVGMGAAEIVDRLETAARRGKLAGFHAENGATAASGGRLFRLTDFGTPFESVLEVSADGQGGGGTRLRFVRRLQRRIPTIFLLVLLLSLWPGVELTDSLLRTYWTGYPLTHWQTWLWYMPIMAVSGWWAWRKAIRQSRETGRSEARELVEKVARQLEG